MLTKLFATAGVAALLMVVPAVAQDTTTDPLLPKKQKSQGNADQGAAQQPQQGAVQKKDKSQPDQSSSGTDASSAQGTTEDQNAQQATDQGTGNKKKKVDQNAQSGGAAGQGSGDQANTKKAQQSQQNDNSQTTGSTGKAADIPTEKRTVIREKLVTKNVTKVDRSKLNIDINVGVAVPSTITLQPLPAEVIDIVPEYRGYDYFVLADGTIIIVEPNSHNIVFILSA